MLGSILTRQYRFATRGIEIGLHTAQQAVGVAGGLAGEVAGGIVGGLAARHGRHNGHGEDDVVAAPEPPVASTLDSGAAPGPDAHARAAPGPGTRSTAGSRASLSARAISRLHRARARPGVR